VAAGDDVVALSRSAAEPETAGARAVAVDLLDAAATGRAVAEGQPEVVYHLAALASVADSWERPGIALTENTLATLNLLEAVRTQAPEARLIVVGSGEVYGRPAALPVDEDAPLRPQNPYAVSKAAIDLLAAMYVDTHGLEIVRVRAFNHAGPRQSTEYVIASLARQVATGLAAGGNPIRVVTGNPEPRRDFTDVRDVVLAYRELAGSAAPDAYNVCSGRATSVAELIDLLREVTGREIAHEVDPARVRAHDVMEIRGSHDRLTAATGWEPRIPLATTLADTVAWWREREATSG
jgi:GDP-4-dehydro-6-deoxy-D-mannose reductase